MTILHELLHAYWDPDGEREKAEGDVSVEGGEPKPFAEVLADAAKEAMDAYEQSHAEVPWATR